MLVSDLVKDPCFEVLNEGNFEIEIDGVYCGDLLSWVMSHAKSNDAWCTVLTHVNIIAIAQLLQLSCVIICEDAPLDNETIKKAKLEGINLITTSLNSVEVIKRMLISNG